MSGSGSIVEGNLISNEIDVASNEYLTKFSVNRNFVKLLSNDVYLLSKVKDDESTVYSYNRYKSYNKDDLVFFKTSLSAQNTYLLCSLTSNNDFVPSCVMNVTGSLVVVNDDHWKMVGVPTLPELSGHSPTDVADEYILSSQKNFIVEHQDNTSISAHPLGPFSRQGSSVLFTDLTNLSKERSTMFYPYKVQKMTSDDTVLDGYMRKWDNGILEYDIVFRVGYQGLTEEGYDHLEANNTEFIHRNMNYMYFKNRKDYAMFSQGGKYQAMVNNQKQTNLNKVINAYVGQIVFPEEFKDLNYMMFSSNVKNITTRTYNTKNDAIPYEELDGRLSVAGLTIVNHTTLSSDEQEKTLYDTPVNIHISVQNIAEEALAYINNRRSHVTINIPSDSDITNIDDKAFYKTQLTSVTIPYSTRHIGTQAFAKCAQLKQIDFYVERDPALHPKIELCAFGETSALTSINVHYRSPSFSLFGASPLDDPEVARLSTYNDMPIEEKLRNEIIRTNIYGISPDFDPANINVTGGPLKAAPLIASTTLVGSSQLLNEEQPEEKKEEEFVTIDVAQFLSDLKSGKVKKSKLMSAPMTFSSAPTPTTLTDFFEFNSDKTELIGWKHDALTDDFEFDSVALLAGSEYSTVTSIADFALSGCNALTSFRAGRPLKKIGYASLSGCTKLDNLVLSDSVLTVGQYAFSDCNLMSNASISCSTTLEIEDNAFSGTLMSKVDILPNSTLKADALPLVANTISADMAGSFFRANALRASQLSTFYAYHLSSSFVDSSVVPPLSGFSFNSFSDCSIRKFIAADEEAHDISSMFMRPETTYPNVKPNNILGFNDRTFVLIDYASYKDRASYLTCISSDGNVYIRQMGNDDWVYQITKGSYTSDGIVGFFYGNIDLPLGSKGWSFLVGSAASQLKHGREITFVGQVIEHGIDVMMGGYYITSDNPGVKNPAFAGYFVIDGEDEFVLSQVGGNDIWVKIDGVSDHVLTTGISNPAVLSLTDVQNDDGTIKFNAYREVWRKVENPITQLTSIVVGDSITNLPLYLSVGDDYSIISCNMEQLADTGDRDDYTVNILSSFTSICADAFNANGLYEYALRKVVIPNTMYSIGDCAFKGNTMLSCLSVQDGTDLHYLGTNVISGCTQLSSFEVKVSV